ncbi:hypothetical protein [Burkholderia vietnamiensis]|uniref:hypothetical protein n=1 Tax=Burkholderia vietnamiensis TaxID=60552 RepID=UPI00264D12E9|nr:hypothetical protein [Burkholderia vietnamiensis]MDN8037040.1 hypothetical protein [Burkholderia vietnamiensis]
MNSKLFEKYESAIRGYLGDPLSPSLRMFRSGELEVYYAPFEWVNPAAKVVFVGITPGKVQANNALVEAQRALVAGLPTPEVLRRAKHAGAFSGRMRPKLIALMDHIGLHRWLGLSSTEELFGDESDLLQTSSLFQYPVFCDGENYSGTTPKPLKDPLLRMQMKEHFGEMAKSMPDAVFLPLGSAASEGVTWLTEQGYMQKERVLHGIPHPSPANAERVAYFLGEKARDKLSVKTSATSLDAAREHLLKMVAALA